MILSVTELDIDNVELCVDELAETVAMHIANNIALVFLRIL